MAVLLLRSASVSCRACRRVFLASSAVAILAGSPGWAADYTVNSEAELAAAITAANSTPETDTITLGTNITLSAALPEIAGGVTIDGSGYSLTGDGSDRIFFVDAAGSSVLIENFSSITGGAAEGGDGGDGLGGGGLGAGGALYVNQGDVSLMNVSFSANSATGGDGGAWQDSANTGGGGGLGGDGGDGGSSGTSGIGGGGGGGGYSGGGGGGGGTSAYTYADNSYVQSDAGAGGSDIQAGGSGSVSGAGAAGFDGGAGGGSASYIDPGSTYSTYVPGYYSPGSCYYSWWGGSYCYYSWYSPGYTYSTYVPGSGSAYAGGGGGGGDTGGGTGGNGFMTGTTSGVGGAGGGGGGLSGTGGSGNSSGGAGGDGSYGGGGAGGTGYAAAGDGGTFGGGGGAIGEAGSGGFGGGGGGSTSGLGGSGGFGGGSGGSVYNSAGVGGAGAGTGSSNTNDSTAGGGGGAGLGGAVFVGAGGTLTIGGNVSFEGSSVSGGAGGGTLATAGAGAGSDLFLMSGTTTNFTPGAGNAIVLSGTIGDDSSWTLDGTVGGVGSGSGATIAVSGGGTVELSGSSTIAGGFTVDNSNLHVTGTGLISAPGVAVELIGAGALLENEGSIDGAWVPGASSAATDINATVLVSASGAIDNSGSIQAGASSNVTAVRADSDLVLLNSGTIAAASGYGVLGTDSGTTLTIDNQATGFINGGSGGIVTAGTIDLTNAGAINSTSGSGVSGASGSIDNVSGGSISGTTGVTFTGGGAFQVTSAGTITGTGGTAIDVTGSGTIELTDGSTTNGDIVTGDSGIVTATLGGTLAGDYVGGAGEDDVTLLTTFSSSGALNGGDGADTLTFGGAGSGSYDMSGPSGFEDIVVDVAGDWTFSGTDGSTADWTILGGTANVGTGAINGSASVDIQDSGILELTGDLQIGSLGGAAGAGVDLGTFVLTAGLNGSSTNFAGEISGAGSLTKTGSGTFTLSGTNSYNGSTIVDAGTLSLANGNAISDTGSVSVAGAATLDLQGSEMIGSLSGDSGSFVTLNSNSLVTGGNGDSTSFAGVISGSGGLTKQGAGTMTLSGANSYTGGTTVEMGTLQLGASDVLADSGAVTVDPGASLDLQGFDETVGTADISGTVSGTGTLAASTYTLDGATIDANLGAGALENVGGTSVLNGNAGASTVLVSGGTLQFGASDRLADTAAVSIDSGASLDLQGFDETVGTADISGTVSGTGTLAASTYTLDGATIDANLGAGALENVGGTSVLNGSAGASTVLVSGGTLQLGASDRLADTAAVSIDSGASLDLQGFDETVGTADISGTVSGTGTLAASTYTLDGATIDANLGDGILNVQGGTSLLNGTSAATEVNLLSGTLQVGGDNRLLTSTDLSIGTGVTFDLQSYDQTVASALISGTLGGSGTLIAATYTLDGATVDGNLGAGTLQVIGGTSVLNGASAATEVGLVSGTLQLGGDQRLLATTDISVGTGFTLDLQSYDQEVASAYIAGLLDGTGTLSAPSYTLEGATVNANLGDGALVNAAGTSVLNGGAGASTVVVSGGTLKLGADERLSDSAALSVAGGATLDLAIFDETVASASIWGTLTGTGLLTAATYELNGATVDANLGDGSLTNSGGTSLLNGTVASETVLIAAGTLELGANERLSDTTMVEVDEAATFDLADHQETIGGLTGAGEVALGDSEPGKLIVNAVDGSVFEGSITGVGDVVKEGDGHFTLAGENSFDGTLDVQAGLLTINGSVLSDVLVDADGMLGGNGTMGSLTMLGNLSPGNSIGQLTVNGNLNFGPGSVYTVEVNPMLEGDRTDVTGSVTISQDATVKVIAADGEYQPLSTYRILTADGGISGEFASVEDNLAFLDPSLVYSAQAVDLLLVRNDVDFSDYAATPNEVSAAGAVQELGPGNPLFKSVVMLSETDAPSAFMQLSGEAYASVLSGMTQSSLQIRNLMLDRPVAGSGFELWGDLVGTWGRIKGRQGIANSKSMDRYGITGLDYRTRGFAIGIAGGLQGGDFDSTQLKSTTDLDSRFFGITAGVAAGMLEIKGASEWTWHDVSTRRALSFGTLDEVETGKFSGTTQQLVVDAAVNLANAPAHLQPFARFARVITKYGDFVEAGGDAALAVDGGRQNVRFGTIGIRVNGDMRFGGGVLSPNLEIGWQRGWGDLDGYSKARFSTGHGFLFEGAQVAKDAADIHAGVDWSKGPFRVGVSYTGFLSRYWTEHGLALKLRLGF